jgi:hypothetical protein
MKAQESMKDSGKFPLDDKVVIDELLIGGPEKNKRVRSNGERKLVPLTVENIKDNKTGWGYVEVL